MGLTVWTAGNNTIALSIFLLGYLFIVFLFASLLGLGWNLDATPTDGAWPHPMRYGRLFHLAFLSLLGALGGFPPFFFLASKLALFSWLISLGAWGSAALGCFLLLIGWYVYWQAASGLFDAGGSNARRSHRLTRSGALVLLSCLLLPIALSGLLLDLWLVGFWLV